MPRINDFKTWLERGELKRSTDAARVPTPCAPSNGVSPPSGMPYKDLDEAWEAYKARACVSRHRAGTATVFTRAKRAGFGRVRI
jgi:hypothetical protein